MEQLNKVVFTSCNKEFLLDLLSFVNYHTRTVSQLLYSYGELSFCNDGINGFKLTYTKNDFSWIGDLYGKFDIDISECENTLIEIDFFHSPVDMEFDYQYETNEDKFASMLFLSEELYLEWYRLVNNFIMRFNLFSQIDCLESLKILNHRFKEYDFLFYNNEFDGLYIGSSSMSHSRYIKIKNSELFKIDYSLFNKGSFDKKMNNDIAGWIVI